MSKQLKLPDPTELKDTNLMLPFKFVGDQRFPLLNSLMKLSSDKFLTSDENYSLFCNLFESHHHYLYFQCLFLVFGVGNKT